MGRTDPPGTRVPHGAYVRYSHGCRCRPCIAAKREYEQAARDRRTGTLAADAPQHGTRNGYEGYRCRCDLCRAAKAAAGADYYQRKAAS